MLAARPDAGDAGAFDFAEIEAERRADEPVAGSARLPARAISVIGIARRSKARASAMSRALARLRETTGDPLLVRDRFVGVVRKGHPLGKAKVTPKRYAAGRHILISRRSDDRGLIDDALEASGLKREIVTIVGSYSEALALTRATDLIASVPERYTGNLRAGLFSFPLPFPENSPIFNNTVDYLKSCYYVQPYG